MKRLLFYFNYNKMNSKPKFKLPLEKLERLQNEGELSRHTVKQTMMDRIGRPITSKEVSPETIRKALESSRIETKSKIAINDSSRSYNKNLDFYVVFYKIFNFSNQF